MVRTTLAGRWRLGVILDRVPKHFGAFSWVGAAYPDLGSIVPFGAPSQRSGYGGDAAVRDRDIRLQVYGLDLEGSLFAVGLRVEPAHEGAVVQYREGVVSVAAFGCRGVDLDLVVKAKELRGPGAVPDHGVEGRKQGREGRLQAAG